VLRQFRDVDKGYDALMKRLVELANPQVRVGVHAAEGQRREAGIRLAKKEGKFHLRGRGGARPVTVLDVATWAEFGIGQPMRSWLRAWYDGGRQQNFADIQKMMVRVLAGKVPLNRALEQLGQRFVGLIQRRLAQGIPPPNAAATIARKGSSKPLIDTGQLRSSITYSTRVKR
jgi:hypothetical protein